MNNKLTESILKKTIILNFVFFSFISYSQTKSEFYVSSNVGVPVSSLKAPTPYIPPSKNNPYFYRFMQSWAVTDYSVGGSFQLEKEYFKKLRLGAEYSYERSYHGMPIANFDGGIVDLYRFNLNRNIIKLNLSRQFHFFDSRIILEPKIKLIKIFEQYDYLNLIVNEGPTTLPNRDYDLNLVVWRNQYITNPKFNYRDLAHVKFEYEINSRFRINDNFMVTANFKASPRRYFMYDYRVLVRTYSPEDGSLTSVSGNNGSLNDDAYVGYGIKNTFLSLGLGLVYSVPYKEKAPKVPKKID
jgi:hypothetical protein